MATIEITEITRDRPRFRLSIATANAFRVYLNRRRERRLLAPLARLSPHLIRDVGFDPDAVYEVVHGNWDYLHPYRHLIGGESTARRSTQI